MAGKPGRSGGTRVGAGRKPGTRNKRTRVIVEAVEKEELVDCVLLLARWANDVTKDDHFRASCAAKAAEFLRPKPARLPDRLPLPHEVSDEMLQDFERRLAEDQLRNPQRYGLPLSKPR